MLALLFAAITCCGSCVHRGDSLLDLRHVHIFSSSHSSNSVNPRAVQNTLPEESQGDNAVFSNHLISPRFLYGKIKVTINHIIETGGNRSVLVHHFTIQNVVQNSFKTYITNYCQGQLLIYSINIFCISCSLPSENYCTFFDALLKNFIKKIH